MGDGAMSVSMGLLIIFLATCCCGVVGVLVWLKLLPDLPQDYGSR